MRNVYGDCKVIRHQSTHSIVLDILTEWEYLALVCITICVWAVLCWKMIFNHSFDKCAGYFRQRTFTTEFYDTHTKCKIFYRLHKYLAFLDSINWCFKRKENMEKDHFYALTQFFFLQKIHSHSNIHKILRLKIYYNGHFETVLLIFQGKSVCTSHNTDRILFRWKTNSFVFLIGILPFELVKARCVSNIG